jgi:hypothetical protein
MQTPGQQSGIFVSGTSVPVARRAACHTTLEWVAGEPVLRNFALLNGSSVVLENRWSKTKSPTGAGRAFAT